MKRAPEQSEAGSSAPAAQRPRTNPSLNAAPPALGAQISRALEAVNTSTAQTLETSTGAVAKPGAPVDPGALAAFLDARHAARRNCQMLEKELQAVGQDLAAEVTVLNINAAALLEKKQFLLQKGERPTVGSVLEAIWARVDQLVEECKYEEARAAANVDRLVLGGGVGWRRQGGAKPCMVTDDQKICFFQNFFFSFSVLERADLLKSIPSGFCIYALRQQ